MGKLAIKLWNYVLKGRKFEQNCILHWRLVSADISDPLSAIRITAKLHINSSLLIMVLTIACDNKLQIWYLCLPRCNSEVYRIHSQIIHGGGITNKDLKEVWKLLYCNREAWSTKWVSISCPDIMLVSSWCLCFNDQLLRRVEDNDLRGDPLQGIGTCEIHKEIPFCVCTATLVPGLTTYVVGSSPYTLTDFSYSDNTCATWQVGNSSTQSFHCYGYW